MNIVKKMLVACCLGMMAMVSGCGSDEAIPAPKKTTAVSATVNDGVATTTAAVKATPANSTIVAFEIPSSVTITGNTNLTAAPEIVVTTPQDGKVSSIPNVTTDGTTFALSNSNGAVDISIPGLSSFTIGGAGATVKIPVVNTTGLTDGGNTEVEALKADGKLLKYSGIYSAAEKTVTVNNVSDFCWFLIKPIWAKITGTSTTPTTPTTTPGTTGSTGGTSSN